MVLNKFLPLPLLLVGIVLGWCDDRPVVGTEVTIPIEGKSLSVRLSRDYHESGNSTLNVQVLGLLGTDQIDAFLVGDEPINVWSVDQQQFFPQDTVMLNQYASRSSSTYEAQIRYTAGAPNAQLIIDLNGENILTRSISVQGGSLAREQFYV